VADFVVTNAGTAAYNDTYTEDGAYGGKPAYTGDTNGMYLFYGGFAIPAPGDGWVLHNSKTDSGGGIIFFAYYYGAGTQATPPEGTYTAGSGGAGDADVAAAPEIYSHADGGSVVVLGGEQSRGPWYNTDGGVVLFDGGADTRGPYYYVGGGEVVFAGGQRVVMPFSQVGGGLVIFAGGGIGDPLISGGVIVFSGGQVVEGNQTYEVAEGGVIIFEGGQMAITHRGGGQSTTEWDWVRGKGR